MNAASRSSHKEDGRHKSVELKKREFACFLCSTKGDEKGIPLLFSQTTFSRICLGEKLQEILGEKFIVLITAKDSICWGCARYINWVDKCERMLDVSKGNILNMVVTKYKNIEMNIKTENVQENTTIIQSRFQANNSYGYGSDTKPHRPSTTNLLGGYAEKVKEEKKRQYECVTCYKVFSTPAALGVHKARQHAVQHVCKFCDVVLSSEAKYKLHMAKHAAKNVDPLSPKMLSCVSCGFRTKNMEAYCRHACDSKIVSLVCFSCRKRYVHKSTNNITGKNLCPECLEYENSKSTQKEMHQPEDVILRQSVLSLKSPVKMMQTNETHQPSVDDIDLAIEMENILNHPEKPPDPEQSEPELMNVLHEVAPDLSSVQHPTILPVVTEDDCFDDPTSNVVVGGDESNQGETISSDLHNEMPEFFRPPQEKRLADQSISEVVDDIITGDVTEEQSLMLARNGNSILKCTTCDVQFELSQLTSHTCFITAPVLEAHEVKPDAEYMSVPVYSGAGHEAPLSPTFRDKRTVNRRRIPKIPAQENIHYSHISEPETKMHCKTCYAEFRTIGLMRQHWDLTGHLREVSTTTIELNKIKDKNNKTEQTFKVVKQNFNIRANVVGQNDEYIRMTDEAYNNCIIKVKETPSIEEFMMGRDGKMCDTCGVIFGDSNLLAEHQCSNCLTCITCHIQFMDNKLLKKHYQYTGHATKILKKPTEPNTAKEEHPVVDPYFCPKCNKTFPARLALNKHLKTHYKGTNKGACHYCLLEFEDKSHIQQHVLEAHGAYLYKCEHCDRAFLTKSVRNKHQMKHVIHVCQICKVKFANQRLLLVHMDKLHRSKACRICGKLITDLYALRRHERRHFYEKGLKCDFCDKSFRTKASLRAHNQTHSDEIHYRCKTCHLGFKTPRNLEDHEIVHIKKQYTCTKCSTVCSSKNFFWIHKKLHESAYKCSVCGRMFRDTSLLAIHKRKHFRARPYQCPRCPRVFSVPATLRRHLTVHTKTHEFKCGLCKKGFLTKYAYHKHLDTVHTTSHPIIPTLSMNTPDDELLHAADIFTGDPIIFNDYPKDAAIEQVPTSDMITEEIVVETTELFDEILN